jgi:lipopolysaccharide export system permease protein
MGAPLKILDRYVLRAWAASLATTTVALLAVVLVADLVGHLEKFMDAPVDSRAALVARYYGVRLPVFFVWVAPMICLAAMMLTLTRFARSNEILPVLAAGLSIRRFLAPAAAGSVLVSVAMFLIDERVVPRFADSFRETERLLQGESGVENVIVTDGAGQDWLARRYSPRDFRLEQVLLVRLGPGSRRLSDVTAKEALWKRSQKGWLLRDGVETTYDPETQRRLPERKPIPPEGLLVPSDLRPNEILESDAMFRISTLSQIERNIALYPHQPFWRVQWHSKWTMPLANIVLLLIGVPLILGAGTRNVFAGVGIAVGLGLVFFATLVAFLDAGNTGRLDPIVATWFPIVLFGALGAAMVDGMMT